MDGVVDQRGDGLALRTLRLDHVHAPVVEVGCVVVVGDLALGLAGSDLDPCGLEAVDGLVDREGGLVTDEIQVLEVAGVSPLAVGEGVAFRSAWVWVEPIKMFAAGIRLTLRAPGRPAPRGTRADRATRWPRKHRPCE